jgi:hypothetical protein
VHAAPLSSFGRRFDVVERIPTKISYTLTVSAEEMMVGVWIPAESGSIFEDAYFVNQTITFKSRERPVDCI